jgi:hypothetical protein
MKASLKESIIVKTNLRKMRRTIARFHGHLQPQRRFKIWMRNNPVFATMRKATGLT